MCYWYWCAIGPARCTNAARPPAHAAAEQVAPLGPAAEKVSQRKGFGTPTTQNRYLHCLLDRTTVEFALTNPAVLVTAIDRACAMHQPRRPPCRAPEPERRGLSKVSQRKGMGMQWGSKHWATRGCSKSSEEGWGLGREGGALCALPNVADPTQSPRSQRAGPCGFPSDRVWGPSSQPPTSRLVCLH